MKKILMVSLLVILLAMTATAFAETWGPLTDDDVDLTITRTQLSAGWWKWEFKVVNDSAVDLHWFTAGFAVDELAPFTSTTGHYQNWATSVASASVLEGPGSIGWYNLNRLVAAGGGTAWFSYDTDLPFVATADYQARDGAVSGDYNGQPAPTIPEPMSIMLGCMGLGSVVGLRRFGKK